MLKKFFLNLLSSFVGAWIALVLFCVVAVVVAIGVAVRLGASDEGGRSTKVDSDSVLLLDLSGTIIETPETGTTYCAPSAIRRSTSSLGIVRELRISPRVWASYWKLGIL